MNEDQFHRDDLDTGLWPTYCPYGCLVELDKCCPHGCRSMKRAEELQQKAEDMGAY